MLSDQPNANNQVSLSPIEWQPLTPPQTPQYKALPQACAPKRPEIVISQSLPSPLPSPGCSSQLGWSAFDRSEDRTSISNQSTVSSHQSLEEQTPSHNKKDNLTTGFPSSQRIEAHFPVTPRGRTAERAVSADIALKARTHFSSPDRFIAHRSPPVDLYSPYRSNKSPDNLTPREKSWRERDHSQDPFHQHGPSRSRQIIRQLSGPRRFNAPHIVPHFVRDQEQGDATRDRSAPANLQRQVSAGAVWNVGGASPAYSGPLPAIDDGRGGLVGSGTTAPLHVAHFLDEGTPNTDIERHRNRLSLALGIDEANRVLRHILPRSLPTSLEGRTNNDCSRFAPFVWQNGAWSQTGATRREYL